MAFFEQRCLYHSSREAVCRCPSCQNYYCRECVLEHEGKLICTRCLAAATQPKQVTDSTKWGLLSVLASGGLLLCWVLQYYLGWAFSQISTTFHEAGL